MTPHAEIELKAFDLAWERLNSRPLSRNSMALMFNSNERVGYEKIIHPRQWEMVAQCRGLIEVGPTYH